MFRIKTTIACIILILFNLSCTREDRQSLVISGGRLDLSEWNFTRNHVRLDGEWEFYWNRLLSAEDFMKGQTPSGVLIAVPSNWNGTLVDGKPIEGSGYATYRLRVKMKYDNRMYGLKLIDCGTSYRLYINNKLIAANGEVAEAEAGFRPEYRPMVVPFTLDEVRHSDDFAEFDIIMQVANFIHPRGGIWESIRLGLYDDMTRLREYRFTIEVVLFGMVLIMVVYHLMLFMFMPQNKSVLYFAIMAAFLGTRTFLTGERAVMTFFPEMNWVLLTKIEFIVSFTAIAFIILFLDDVFKGRMPKIPNAIIVGLGGIIFVIIAATGVNFFIRIKFVYELYMFLSGIYAITVLAVLSIKRVRGALIALVGLSAIYLAGVNDVLYSNMVINTMYLMPIALFIFILAQSSLLSMFFMRAFAIARDEAEINREQNLKIQRQNEFITNVLKKASDSILQSAERISGSIDQFRDNERDQAAHTEEVASSIEEIAAGTNLVADNTEIQNSNLELLDNSIRDLAEVIQGTGKEVADALETVQRISRDARSGNEAIATMGHSINKIFESSSQVNGIIQIINDISDRINLLSLNAAIEAARAGDSGRGFAVVADEISKLADQTASSIKEIDSLIKTNDSEIRIGADNIKKAVESLTAVISNIEIINGKIVSVSEFMQRQLGLNEAITKGAETVRKGSSQIKMAMKDQRRGIDDISGIVAGINEIAQRNSQAIEQIAEASKFLVEMVDRFSSEISNYRD